MTVNVSIVPCRDYSPEALDAALRAALEPLGGLDWVKPGMNVADQDQPHLAYAARERRRDAPGVPRRAHAAAEGARRARHSRGQLRRPLHPGLDTRRVRRRGDGGGRPGRRRAERGFRECGGRLPRGRHGKALPLHRLAQEGGRRHRFRQAQDPRHGQHDLRGEELLRLHPRHPQAGDALSAPRAWRSSAPCWCDLAAVQRAAAYAGGRGSSAWRATAPARASRGTWARCWRRTRPSTPTWSARGS